ncbi:MAG TPA: biotin--[acetyl-CoA-carboxylase] ligase [Acidimicrobiia bacterium]|jgi:BirA family biotin operon repressor/biotin-[acetyl-CoA-carboxylase] ligase|nr:biotin--[acetyl-CoA-carboxylase] ligase [Acidimicrobiia bacterium]
MATPYLQLWVEEVSSTQDLAREEVGRLPVLVAAERQTAGRGRGGAAWLSAPRALAASLAFRPSDDDLRPFSLMAGVAAARGLNDVSLKWPNDLMSDGVKVGGILVERADEVVVGMGLNLWWPEAPEGIGALDDEDPGAGLHAQIAGLWAAELMRLVEAGGWPLDEYRSLCTTLGKTISWEPEGRGRAVDVAEDGGLVVEVSGARQTLTSGAIRHLRH